VTGIFALPTSLSNQPVSSDEGAPETRYAYKASLIGSAHQFELTDAGLSWQIAGRAGIWAYPDIASVRLTFRPVSMQSRRFRADLTSKEKRRIAILSTTWQTVSLMAPQDHGYRAFIAALHRRTAAAGGKPVLIGGISRPSYAAALAIVTILAISMAALLARALSIGEWYGALFLVGFAALFTWQIGGFIKRNRPRSYDFDHLPEALLP
jgi:hypothetical protein